MNDRFTPPSTAVEAGTRIATEHTFETHAATITSPTDQGPNGATSAKGRYNAASETTSASSLR